MSTFDAVLLAEAMHNVRNHGPHDAAHALVAHPHKLDTTLAERVIAEHARLAAARAAETQPSEDG